MNQTGTPEANKQTGNGIDSDARKAGMQGSQSTSSTGMGSGTGAGAGTGTGSSTRTGLNRETGSTFGSQSGYQSEAQQHSEGVVARTIEEQTAKLPSDTFLWSAVAAMGVSAYFEFTGDKDKSRFIGQWVAPLLLFGVYNKLVKQQGSDRIHS